MTSEQQFEPGSEQFLAAVLYVAHDAQRAWERHKRYKGRLTRWWYLNRTLKRLEIDEQIALPYSAMRAELIRFAESFGVVGYVPNTASNQGAASAFDDIEE